MPFSMRRKMAKVLPDSIEQQFRLLEVQQSHDRQLRALGIGQKMLGAFKVLPEPYVVRPDMFFVTMSTSPIRQKEISPILHYRRTSVNADTGNGELLSIHTAILPDMTQPAYPFTNDDLYEAVKMCVELKNLQLQGYLPDLSASGGTIDDVRMVQ